MQTDVINVYYLYNNRGFRALNKRGKTIDLRFFGLRIRERQNNKGFWAPVKRDKAIEAVRPPDKRDTTIEVLRVPDKIDTTIESLGLQKTPIQQ